MIKGCPSTSGDDYQLNTITFIKHAARTYPEVEIASRLLDGSMLRYTYADASVTLTYQAGPGTTFEAHLSAADLKPNFAYQVKLVGKPTGLWGEDGDDLANENIGYIPDRKAYADGGYQTRMGRHSKLEVGTGEAMVDQAVAMVDDSRSAGI